MKITKTPLTSALLFAAAASASSAQITTEYRHVFTSSLSVGSAGIGVILKQSDNDVVTTFSGAGQDTVSITTGGPQQTLAGINSASTTGPGYLSISRLSDANRTTAALFYTTEYFNTPSDVGSTFTANLASISFNVGNSMASTGSVAVKIDSTWYVQAGTTLTTVASGGTGSGAFSATGSTPNGALTVSVTNFSQTNWYQLDTTNLSVSATAVNLAGGTVTSVGMFIDGMTANGGFVRMDNLEVSTSPIPEPSAFAALAGLGALGLVATRRRRAAR